MEAKDKQINLRVSKKDRDRIKYLAKENDYSSISEYLIQSGLGKTNGISVLGKKIYTLTLNPAIDYIIKTDAELAEIANFTPEEKVFEAGGKGINASIILEEFGARNSAIHYSGGFTGDLIMKDLHDKSIQNIQIKSDDTTRINLKLNFKNDNFEINSTATPLSQNAKDAILKQIAHFQEEETLMIMGSFHPNDEKFLIEISKAAKAKKVELVYDLSKPVIKDLLKFKPLIIKPNNEELEMIFGRKVKTKKDILDCMDELKKMGAKNVAVTMGKDGGYLLDSKNQLFQAEVEPIQLVSPQGSGDSFISTFVHKIDQGSEEAFKWANAAGAATAQVKGLANKALIDSTLSKVKVKKIN